MEGTDPFEAPGEAPLGPRPFTVTQIAVATFLGSAVAGAVLMHLTARRLGGDVRRTSMIAFGVALALLCFVMLLPENFPTIPINVGTMFLMQGLARAELGDSVTGHTEGGGAVASWWEVVGISLLTVLALGSIVVAVALVVPI